MKEIYQTWGCLSPFVIMMLAVFFYLIGGLLLIKLIKIYKQYKNKIMKQDIDWIEFILWTIICIGSGIIIGVGIANSIYNIVYF